ncbi:type 4a pilus biogenesis protein PilO [Neisseriaceae bacterium JH1-16]|nr:type 4a pilus biogenesis protein PilO [Neisseriaceae bacterium JH1-16]
MTLAELARLDPKRLPDWPLPAQLLALGLLLVPLALLGGRLWLAEPLARLAAANAEESVLKQRYADRQQSALDLAELERQLATLRRADEAGATTQPSRITLQNLLGDIHRAATTRNLQVELIRPGQEARLAEAVERPIALKLLGGYADLAAFTGDLARLPRPVVLTDLALQTLDGRAERLALHATLLSYRLPDSAEPAAPSTKGAPR